MRAEAALLLIAVAMIVIIIEAGLADADHAGVLGRSYEFGGIDVGMLVGLVRMNADRRPDVRLALRRADDVGPFALAGRDVEHRRHPPLPRTRQHRRLLLDEPRIVEVTM